MTLATSPIAGTERGYAVLRPAVLKPREAMILRCVWRAWASHRTLSYREIVAETGLPLVMLNFYLKSRQNQGERNKSHCGLIEKGWLIEGSAIRRTLRPGPRFAAMQGETVYEALT